MQDGNIVTQIILPISLAFIMLTLGLALRWADFRRVAVQPKDFFVGAVSQVVLLPLVAFALVSLWPIDPALAVGVMILAACPGGVTSNLLTHIARGDTALSVSLTAVISLLAVFTLPFIVGFSIVHFMDAATAPKLNVIETIAGVFVITTVPVLVGMMIRHLAPRIAKASERIARHVATTLFVLIVLGAIASERANIVSYFIQAGPVTLVLNVIMLLLAFGLGAVFRLGRAQRTAITLECGLQNSTLAIFVGATLLKNTTMIVPGGIYGLIMFATAGIYMWGVLRRRPTSAAA
ncbi:MAG: bile acid:sodium symporter family protein [Alphaproteobacteria bacterium]|nr:bile acid:sodium symporter family protein [Alphaproteobacteria bacterium]